MVFDDFSFLFSKFFSLVIVVNLLMFLLSVFWGVVVVIVLNFSFFNGSSFLLSVLMVILI